MYRKWGLLKKGTTTKNAEMKAIRIGTRVETYVK